MQMITIYKMLNTSRWYPVCEISSRPRSFTKRAVANLSDILRRSLWLQRSAPAYGFTHSCITVLSDM